MIQFLVTYNYIAYKIVCRNSITYIHHVSYNQLLVNAFFLILSTNIINPHSHTIMHTIVKCIYVSTTFPKCIQAEILVCICGKHELN